MHTVNPKAHITRNVSPASAHTALFRRGMRRSRRR